LPGAFNVFNPMIQPKKDGTTRLLLVRHGKTHNPENRCYGWRDIPLSGEGRAAVADTANNWRDVHIDAVIASDFSRTVESAVPFAEARGLTVEAFPELREINFGDIEGLVFAEVERQFPETAAHWISNPETVRFPGGECFDDVCGRVNRWLDGWLSENQGKTALAVVHSGTIRALLRRMTGCEPHATLMVKIAYGDAFLCDRDDATGDWTPLLKFEAGSDTGHDVRDMLAGK
jgi:alpha-ribazole phosphatase